MTSELVFSIICPLFNAEMTLSAAVESVIKQDYLRWELILIDDGSTDNTGSICDMYTSSDNRIKVIHELNQGQSTARLKGIAESRGDYILFLDGDDFFQPNALEVLAKKLNDNAVDVILYNARKKIGNDFENVYTLNNKETIKDRNKILFECFSKRTAGYFWTYCFKRELFKIADDIKNKYTRIKYSEDVYLTYQIIKNNVQTLTILPSCLYTYVINNNSITHTQTAHKVKDRFDVFNEVYFDLYEHFRIVPFKDIKTNIGWTYLSYLNRSAKEYDYLKFKEICLTIRNSFIFKKMSHFKKDEFNSLIHLLFKLRMYKKAYSIIRRH